MRLQGKRAFITAAGQGIGKAIAQAYIREGAIVIATDLNAELLTDLVGATTMALNVLDKDALTQTVTEAKPDILVNWAGYVHGGAITDATDQEFDFAMNLNVRSQFHSMQAAIPGMIARGGGASDVALERMVEPVSQPVHLVGVHREPGCHGMAAALAGEPGLHAGADRESQIRARDPAPRARGGPVRTAAQGQGAGTGRYRCAERGRDRRGDRRPARPR